MIKNAEFTVTIEGYTSEAYGVARVDGRAVFVPRTLEGEIWRIRIVKVTSAAVYARAMECLQASAERAEPLCPYSGKCGGCDTWQMSYAEECRFKLQRVNDALQRIARQTVHADEILACDRPERYRNKGVFNIAACDGKAVYGFYRERSHDLIPIDACLIQMPLGEKVSQAVTSFMNRNGLLPYDEATGKGTVRHVFCRSAVYTADAVACIISARGFGALTASLVSELRMQCPELTGIVLCINRERLNSVLSGSFHTLYGSPNLHDSLCGHSFEISPQAFYQINPLQAEKLYRKAVEYACEGGTDFALELYCGAGTISLSLAEAFASVEATEIVPQAIENAKENARRNGIANISFACEDAAQTALRFAHTDKKPDCVVVDPPRKGMEPAAVRAVAEISPASVVYVSCNPATLARDILLFQGLGYQLRKATAVDMFPRTCHVETVVLLTKADGTGLKNTK